MKTTTDIMIKIGAFEMTLTDLPISEHDIESFLVTEPPVKSRKTRTMTKKLLNGGRGIALAPNTVAVIPQRQGYLTDQVVSILHRSNHKKGLKLNQILTRARKVFPKLTQKSLAGILTALNNDGRVRRTGKAGSYQYKHPLGLAAKARTFNMESTYEGGGDLDDQPVIMPGQSDFIVPAEQLVSEEFDHVV
jgi:hypothetical protein